MKTVIFSYTIAQNLEDEVADIPLFKRRLLEDFKDQVMDLKFDEIPDNHFVIIEEENPHPGLSKSNYKNVNKVENESTLFSDSTNTFHMGNENNE